MHSQSRQSVRQIQPYEIQSFTRTCEELAIAKTGFDFRFRAKLVQYCSGVFAPRETHARDDVGSHDHDHIFTKAEIPHSPVIAKRGHHAALRVELCSAPHLTARGF